MVMNTTVFKPRPSQYRKKKKTFYGLNEQQLSLAIVWLCGKTVKGVNNDKTK